MWDYSGHTIVSNSEVRLVPDHQSKEGRIWNTVVSIGIPKCPLGSHFKAEKVFETLT